jgi:hypothetical protein
MNTKTSTIDESPVCPRCRSADTSVLTRSPVKDVWIVHGCKVCFYAWRNTEPEENTNPDKYPEAFRLNPNEVNNFVTVPTVPPLRSRGENR